MEDNEIETEPEALFTDDATWDEADEGDRRYDEMVERSLFDPQTHGEWMFRHAFTHPASLTFPDIDTGTPDGMEPETERARRRAPIREAA